MGPATKTSSVLRHLLKSIFQAKLLAVITWSGVSRKLGPGEEMQFNRHALCDYKGVVDMFVGKIH